MTRCTLNRIVGLGLRRGAGVVIAALLIAAGPCGADAGDGASAGRDADQVDDAAAMLQKLRDAARRTDRPPADRVTAARESVALRERLLADRSETPAEWWLDQAEDLLLLLLPAEGDDLMIAFGRPDAQQRARAAATIASAQAALTRFAERPDADPALRRRALLLQGIAMALVAETKPLHDGRRDRERAVAILAPMLIDLEPASRRLAQGHLALALAGLAEGEEADALTTMIAEDPAATAAEKLRAALTTVVSRLHGPEGARAALSRLDRIRSDARASGGPADAFTRLLLADLESRLLEALAPGGPTAQPAWTPYRALLAEAPRGVRESLRSAALSRVAALIDPGANPAGLAPLPAIAAASRSAVDPRRRPEAIERLTALIGDDATPALERSLAAARLADAQLASGDALAAARVLHEVALRHPTAAESIDTIARAATIASAAGRRSSEAFDATRSETLALLREILDTALEHFPELPDRDRWLAESAWLALSEGRHDDAVTAVEAIPKRSDWWARAQPLAVDAAVRRARLARDGVDAAEARALWEAALVRTETSTAAIEATLDASDAASGHAAEAPQFRDAMLASLDRLRLWRAEILLELDRPAEALRIVDAIGSATPAAIDPVAAALRIKLLARLGRVEDAEATLGRFIERFPDAARRTIAEWISEDVRRIDRLLERGHIESAAAIGQERLAWLARSGRSLLDGSSIERIPPHERLSLVRLVAEAFWLADQPALALETIASLDVSDRESVEFVALRAQSLARLGGEQRLAEAMLLAKRIAAARRGERDRWFWLAETLQLEILRAVGRRTEQIGPRVEQLRLLDPALGGERWRRRLEAAVPRES